MSIIFQQSDSHGNVTLDGDLTLAQAGELRMSLIKALIDADDVVLRFGSVTEVDLSSLQLLCSAHRSAVRLNKQLVFFGKWPEPFRKAVEDAGYGRVTGCRLDCGNSCLWITR